MRTKIIKEQSESSEEYLDTMALLIDELISKEKKHLLAGIPHFLYYIQKPKDQREGFEKLKTKLLTKRLKQPIDQNETFGKSQIELLMGLEQPIISSKLETVENLYKGLISYYSLLKLANQYQKAERKASTFDNAPEVSIFLRIWNSIDDYSSSPPKSDDHSNIPPQIII